MSDNEKWHVRVLGSEWGPLNREGLQHLVKTGGLSEDDSIRQVDQTEWLPAATLTDLFAEVADQQAASSSEPSETSDVTEPDAIDDTRPAIESSEPEPVEQTTPEPAEEGDATYQLRTPQAATDRDDNVLGSGKDSPGDTALSDDLADDLAAEMDQEFLDNLSASDDEDAADTDEDTSAESSKESAAVASKKSSEATASQPTPEPEPATAKSQKPAGSPLHQAGILLWAHLRYNSIIHVVMVVGIAFAVLWNVVIAPPEKTAMQTYQEVWDELKSMRQRGASDSEWGKFAARSEERIDDIVEGLESSASASNPARQELLWAGNRFLRLMLQDARGEASQSEENFVKHIEKAKRALDGTEPKFGEDDPPAKSDTDAVTETNLPFGVGPATNGPPGGPAGK